jgi:hypothetical protein
MDRGVLYVVWGEAAEAPLRRSIDSLARFHPDLPVKVVRLSADDPEALFAKAPLASFSPFRETLFLDIDTVVLGALDYGFDRAARFGLACCIAPCPWARRHVGVGGETIEYNTGVLFFTDRARPVFERWQSLASAIAALPVPRHKKTNNDQGPFARAVEETGFCPFVLPPNWNFRPQWQESFFGPIKIWHDYADPPAELIAINRRYDLPDAPIAYHRLGRSVE